MSGMVILPAVNVIKNIEDIFEIVKLLCLNFWKYNIFNPWKTAESYFYDMKREDF